MQRKFKCVNARRFPSNCEGKGPYEAIVFPHAQITEELIWLGEFSTFYEAANVAARYDLIKNDGARGCAVLIKGAVRPLSRLTPHQVFYTTKAAE